MCGVWGAGWVGQLPRCSRPIPDAPPPPSSAPSHPRSLPNRSYRYPPKRSVPDEAGVARGVAGTCELLNARLLSDQPLAGWAWCPGHAGLAAAALMDNTLRVLLITRLERL